MIAPRDRRPPRCSKPSPPASGSDPTRPRWSGSSPRPARRCSWPSLPRAAARPSRSLPSRWPGPPTATPSSALPRPPCGGAGKVRAELGDGVAATDTLAKLVHAVTTGMAVRLGRRDRPRQPADRRRGGHGRRRSTSPPSSTTPTNAARRCGSSATTGSSPRSAPGSAPRHRAHPGCRHPRRGASVQPPGRPTEPRRSRRLARDPPW